jgi:predicted nuclease of predicted toxin-antitoxin system
MLRLLFDQDFNHNIVRGLFLRFPNLDGVAARHAGLAEAPDAELLDWAAHQHRIVVTHDVNTMPDHAYQRIRHGEPVAGVFVVPQELPIGQAIAELEVLASCSFEGEWDNLIVFIPL